MFFSLSRLFSIFINPLLYFWLGIAVLFWRYRKKYPIFKWSIALGIYFLLLISPISLCFIQYWENLHPAIFPQEKLDAVVVLGGGSIYHDEEKDQYVLGNNFPRFLEGSRIILKDKARFIIASGGEPNQLPAKIKGESQSYSIWLKELGIDEQRIIIEDRSFNTYQEALFLREIFAKYQIKKFYLVTSALHMPRSMAVFQKQGFNPVAYPVGHLVTSLNHDHFPWKIGNLEKLNSLLHEIVGFMTYKMANYL